MPTEIVLTTLPNGFDGGDLLASIHVSPRFTTGNGNDAPLSEFPLFVDWPSTLSQVEWSASIDGVPATVLVESQPSSPVWRAAFGPTTGVFSYTPQDFSGAPIHSFPTAAVQDFLAAEYGRYGVGAAEDYALADDLLDPGSVGPLRFTGGDGARRRNQILGLLAEERNANGFTASSATSVDPAREFLQVIDFHTPPTDNLLAEIPLVDLDVHRVITLVQGYPTLLRLLGLVLDVRLRVDVAAVPVGPVGVQVDVDWGALSPPAMVKPFTAALFDPATQVFRAQPTTGPSNEELQVVDGYLPLDDPSRYQVVQVDTDGGAEKLIDLAGNVHQSRNLHRTVDTPTRFSLPALQTAGVGVARVGMGGQLRRLAERGQGIEADIANGATSPTVHAEDLVRGIRADVYDVAAARWFPLCARTGNIQLPGVAPIAEPVEGTVGTTPAGAADGSVPDLYVPESLFHWVGWSLVVAKPGAQVANRPDRSGNAISGEDIDPNNAAVSRTPIVAHPDIDLTQEFVVPPASLPRLRFGRQYRLRARAADLAGNGEPLGDPSSTDFSRATPEFTFRRFEPVASPPVLMRNEPVPSEVVERIVIRTDNDTGTASTPSSERHVVPPRSSQDMAERHGLLDTGPNGALDASRYAEIASADAERLDTYGQPPAQVPVADFDDVFRYTEPMIDVRYLPDGLARGATLHYVDGPHAGQFVEVAYDASAGWPAARGFRLNAREGTGLATLTVDDATERVVDVPLQPADIVHVRISSDIDEADLDLLAVWQWIVARANKLGINLSGLRQRAASGRHWMLTPHRTLTFVHAVKKPLVDPAFVTFTPGRVLGATFATLARLISFDRPSTQKVSLIGAWEEPVDRGPGMNLPVGPDTASPFSLRTEAVAFSRDFDYGTPEPQTEFAGPHEFNDTKRRDVTYRLVATSRFPEHFAQRVGLTVPSVGQPMTIDASGVAAGTVEVRTPDGPVSPVDYTVDAAAGTVVFGGGAQVSAPPPGTTVDVGYVPGSITTVSEPELRIIPSSARPSAPSLRYAIPTFGWQSGGSQFKYSRRRGGGLRVYLERPWWSSGEGELLGVVTLPSAEPGESSPFEVPDRLAPYVTQWGLDPVYSSASLPHPFPRTADFTSAVATGTGFELAEVPVAANPSGVNVAGHEVQYDADRDLWFSDITVAAGSAYQPMLRLALCRYQPESVTGAHLSPIALASFSQLSADRFCVVYGTRGPSQQVLVSGHSYGATEAGAGPSVVEVEVERRDPKWGDDVVGWRPIGRAVRLTAVSGPSQVMWTGTVQRPPGQDEVRLVITEYEEHRTGDDPLGSPVVDRGRRPVYVDIIALS